MFKKCTNSKYRNFECKESRSSMPARTLQGFNRDHQNRPCIRSLPVSTQPRVKPSIRWMIYLVLAMSLTINHDQSPFSCINYRFTKTKRTILFVSLIGQQHNTVRKTVLISLVCSLSNCKQTPFASRLKCIRSSTG